jgi:hypothetical protein
MSVRAKWLIVGFTGGFVFSNLLMAAIVSHMSRSTKFAVGIYNPAIFYLWPLAIWIPLLLVCFAWGTKAQKIAAGSANAAEWMNQIVRYALLISAILVVWYLWIFFATLPLATMKG